MAKKCYHGSQKSFDCFNLDFAGEATGTKFGYGVYLTDVEKSAVHYSQPRNVPLEDVPNHYLYTVEIPDLTPENHLISNQPVEPVILAKVEKKLGKTAPAEIIGKEFRKWVGMTLLGLDKLKTSSEKFEAEKKAAEFFDSIGVFYNVWPNAQKAGMTAQSIREGNKNIAVFNAKRIKIVKKESIDVTLKCGKYVLVNREEI